MANKEYTKDDWQKFRNEILELVMIYKQIKEYSSFDYDKIKYVKSFFYLSKNNAIAAFFIKLGFILDNGTPTLRNFISEEEVIELLKIYTPKIKLLRDKFYAHNNKNSITSLRINEIEIDELFSKIISLSKEVDNKYQDAFVYEFICNYEGIKCLENIIETSNELHELKEKILANNLEVIIKLDITSGKLRISE